MTEYRQEQYQPIENASFLTFDSAILSSTLRRYEHPIRKKLQLLAIVNYSDLIWQPNAVNVLKQLLYDLQKTKPATTDYYKIS